MLQEFVIKLLQAKNILHAELNLLNPIGHQLMAGSKHVLWNNRDVKWGRDIPSNLTGNFWAKYILISVDITMPSKSEIKNYEAAAQWPNSENLERLVGMIKIGWNHNTFQKILNQYFSLNIFWGILDKIIR